jgi:hypothetical protein
MADMYASQENRNVWNVEYESFVNTFRVIDEGGGWLLAAGFWLLAFGLWPPAASSQ